MKKIILKLILLLLLVSPKLEANADKILVCLPVQDFTARQFTFQIKPSQGQCNKNEEIYEVKKSDQGITLLLPFSPNIQDTQPTVTPTRIKTGRSIY